MAADELLAGALATGFVTSAAFGLAEAACATGDFAPFLTAFLSDCVSALLRIKLADDTVF